MCIVNVIVNVYFLRIAYCANMLMWMSTMNEWTRAKGRAQQNVFYLRHLRRHVLSQTIDSLLWDRVAAGINRSCTERNQLVIVMP